MAFSEDIKKEFIEEIPHKTCCRRALAYGLLFDAYVEGDVVYIDTQSGEHADFYKSVFERQFSKAVSILPIKKAGREFFRVEFTFGSMAKKVASLDRMGAGIKDYMEFKCNFCRMNFVRGIFLSRATITFSAGSNHLEFRIQHPERARILTEFLTACKIEPKTVSRRNATGIYYKKADRIEDILNLMQANNAFFEVMNRRIERDIIIQENRAVNCESVNIAKAVATAQKQLRAIEIIQNAGLLEKIGHELTESAKLRLEHHSASLSELAAMHEPPITKSTLNNRFAKIFKMAENIANRK
ncbi:MAG: DNA-binding protein WhiA [Clostridia bacterium]|nr:DNA-binding protein WhiA [Clostridia bacterium]